MNVQELYALALWFEDQQPELVRLYNALLAPLQHNATQPNKQPIEAPLTELLSYLGDMSFSDLTVQQLQMLDNLEVKDVIGNEGVSFIKSNIVTTEYDPATAVENVNRAVAAINTAHKKFTTYRTSVENLGIELDEFEDVADHITVRICFQNDASIEHIPDWKNSAKDWFDIIRGVSMAAGEKPEDVRVIGATKGSLILVLAATVPIVVLLAVISKNITKVAKDVISIGIEWENLRQKKLLTKAMDAEFKKMQIETQNNGVQAVMDAVKLKLEGSTANDTLIALENSVKKLLKFNEKGGNVDFVAPVVNEDGEEGGVVDGLDEVRQLIRDYHGEREAMKLLTDQGGNQSENTNV